MEGENDCEYLSYCYSKTIVKSNMCFCLIVDVQSLRTLICSVWRFGLELKKMAIIILFLP